MLKTRVIPVILWDGMNCVQTVKFARPARVFGSLMDAVQVYERRNIDELILLDIDADRRPEPLFEAISTLTSWLFCPVTYGGGIRTLGHIERALRAGADKVAIRRAATPEFIETAAKKFGSQAIVRVIDTTVTLPLLNSPSVIAQDAERAGAGEILLTSIDRNGTMSGYNTALIISVASSVNIPVIAHGGCGEPKHMLAAIAAGAHAAAASTMFLFTETTPRDCSRYLAEHGVAARVA
jgi:cyclase